MSEFFTIKNNVTSTGAYLDISSSKISYVKINCAYATSLTSGSPASSLIRAQSWTSVASPQKQHQIQERKSFCFSSDSNLSSSTC
nr:hyp [Cotesia vestalis bracovirus]